MYIIMYIHICSLHDSSVISKHVIALADERSAYPQTCVDEQVRCDFCFSDGRKSVKSKITRWTLSNGKRANHSLNECEG